MAIKQLGNGLIFFSVLQFVGSFIILFYEKGQPDVVIFRAFGAYVVDGIYIFSYPVICTMLIAGGVVFLIIGFALIGYDKNRTQSNH